MPSSGQENADSRVVVVGSGFSGLSVAKALANAGWKNVKILEARDRIGGRTVTEDIADTGALVDVGAAWIHGTENNPLVDMCQLYNVEYVEHKELKDPGPAAVVEVTSGKRVALTSDELHSNLAYLNEAVPTIKPGQSASEAFSAFLDGKGLTEGSPERVRAEFVMQAPVAPTSGPMDQLNVYYPINKITGRLADGYDQLIVGGYNSLINKLAEDLDISTNKVVTNIELQNDEKEIKITCNDGEEVTADYVIVTVPLGVLKENKIKFFPPLPEAKTDAMCKLDMGNFEKVILVFEEKFWQGFTDICEFKDNVIIVNAMTNGMRPFPTLIDVSSKAGMPIIVCLYEGLFARHAQDTMTDDEMIAGTRRHLAFALDMEEKDIPPCKGAACTRWRSDPYSHGSYSYFTKQSKPEDMDAIAEPCFNGRLMFAGEHTIKEHNATVHGAVISGLREAQRLDENAAIEGVKPGVIPLPQP